MSYSRKWPLVAESSPSIADVQRISTALCERAPVQALDEQELLWLGAGPDQAHDIRMVQPHQQAHFKLQLLRVHAKHQHQHSQPGMIFPFMI